MPRFDPWRSSRNVEIAVHQARPTPLGRCGSARRARVAEDAVELKEDDRALAVLQALPPDGSTIGNGRLRDSLGLDPELYSATTADLKARGLVVAGRGRGGSLALSADGVAVQAQLLEGEPTATGTSPPNPSPARRASARSTSDETPPASTRMSVPTALTQQELESRLGSRELATRARRPCGLQGVHLPALVLQADLRRLGRRT